LDDLDQDAELQRGLPDLQAQRAAILKAKQETAEQIAKFGAHGTAENDPDRQRLVQRLQGLGIALTDIDRQISAIPTPMAHTDRVAHVNDLVRRAGGAS
jgi:hypothetical protein